MSRRLLDKLPKLMQDPELSAEREEAGEEFSDARARCETAQRALVVGEKSETPASSSSRKEQRVQLNIFQRGILQFFFSIVIASLFMYAGLSVFIYLYHADIFSQNTIVIFFGLASASAIVAISFLL